MRTHYTAFRAYARVVEVTLTDHSNTYDIEVRNLLGSVRVRGDAAYVCVLPALSEERALAAADAIAKAYALALGVN